MREITKVGNINWATEEYKIKPNDRQTTCPRCHTEFTFNYDQDTRNICYGHGEYFDTVNCPLCSFRITEFDCKFKKILV